MKKIDFTRFFLTVLLSSLLAGCSTVTGVDPGASNPNLAAQVAQAPTASGPQEGIKVHGHWTIEVRDPDGALATRREFENALVGNGDIPRILGRIISVGKWKVSLNGGACAGGCSIAESGASILPGATYFFTLTVAVPQSGVNSGKLVLSGNATASFDGSIISVTTIYESCLASVAPASCTSTTGEYLTDTTLSPAVSVTAGQQILVTVAISFS